MNGAILIQSAQNSNSGCSQIWVNTLLLPRFASKCSHALTYKKTGIAHCKLGGLEVTICYNDRRQLFGCSNNLFSGITGTNWAQTHISVEASQQSCVGFPFKNCNFTKREEIVLWLSSRNARRLCCGLVIASIDMFLTRKSTQSQTTDNLVACNIS